MTPRDTPSPDFALHVLDEAGLPGDPALVRAVQDLGALGTGPVPEPSEELARLMAAGGRAPQRRRHQRRITFIGGALAVSMGVGMSGVAAGTLHVPGGLGDAFGSIARFTVREDADRTERPAAPWAGGATEDRAPSATGPTPAPRSSTSVGERENAVPAAPAEADAAPGASPLSDPGAGAVLPDAGVHGPGVQADAPPGPAATPAAPQPGSAPTRSDDPAPPIAPGHSAGDAAGAGTAPGGRTLGSQKKDVRGTGGESTRPPQVGPGRQRGDVAGPAPQDHTPAASPTRSTKQGYARSFTDGAQLEDAVVLSAPVTPEDEWTALFLGDPFLADPFLGDAMPGPGVPDPGSSLPADPSAPDTVPLEVEPIPPAAADAGPERPVSTVAEPVASAPGTAPEAPATGSTSEEPAPPAPGMASAAG